MCKDNTKSKTARVVGALRQRIMAGALPPGSRLPTYDEMVEAFDASRAVLQRAVRCLREDGFVRSVDRQGLFASDTPPHLCRFGLLFANSPGDQEWSRMNAILLAEAQHLARSRPDRQFALYTGLRDADRGQAVFARLLADVKAQRLAGLVAMPGTLDLLRTPPLDRDTLPKVHVCAYEPLQLNMTLSVDGPGFYQRAIQRLVEKGRTRIAIVHMADTASDLDHRELFAAAGVAYREPWVQWIGRSHPEYVANLVTLLLDYPADERPDGLIIADDNLSEHAAAGIVSSGLRVGIDLDVVAHCNWPWNLPPVLPFERIGFSITDLLQRSVDSIRAVRTGATPPTIQTIPAQFEWEIPSLPATTKGDF